MAAYNYPAPRAPEYQKPTSIDDCLPQARFLVNKESGFMRLGLGPVRDKDRILILSLPDQDPFVAKAVSQAFKEKGAEQVDFIYPQDFGKEAPNTTVADGWQEVEIMKKGIASGSHTESDLLTGLGLGEELRKYLGAHTEYTGVFYDVGGGNAKRALKEQADKWRGFWPFNNWEEFLCKAWAFPGDVWMEMERRVVEALGKASRVRITDPEGTHLEFSITPEAAKRWEMNAWLTGHLLLDPLMTTTHELWESPKVHPDVPPVFSGMNGVLAGTSNHCGYFPRIELYFERGRLVGLKGGGKYGEGITEMMEKYKNVQWPGYPDKGYFWYCDTALCTSVKAFRRKSDRLNGYWIFPNIAERTRAGVMHLGFGCRRHGKDFAKYIRENKLPTGHIHVHLYFPTFEIKIQGSEYWYKVVDKGYISALSDIEVRALAARYGNPDEILSFDWIPPLPGINCEGDYFRDYANDPFGYQEKRARENKTI